MSHLLALWAGGCVGLFGFLMWRTIPKMLAKEDPGPVLVFGCFVVALVCSLLWPIALMIVGVVEFLLWRAGKYA